MFKRRLLIRFLRFRQSGKFIPSPGPVEESFLPPADFSQLKRPASLDGGEDIDQSTGFQLERRPKGFALMAIRRGTFGAAALFILLLAGSAPAENWPQWRGPRLDGVSQETGFPVAWSQTEGILWRLPLPGAGGASPVVWGDHIFLTTADGDKLALFCVSTDGELIWRREMGAGNDVVRNGEGNSASPSPSTDGKHVWAMMGTGEFACFDFEGNQVWRYNLQDRFGAFQIQFGMTSTPILDKDRLYLQLIHSGGASVIALDKSTGEPVWRQKRPSDAYAECEHSYASPTIYRDGKLEYLITHGADYVVGHSLADGSELWRCGGMNPRGTYNATLRFVASPTAVPGLIVVPSAKRGPVLGLAPEIKGDVTEAADAHRWVRGRDTPDVPCPLIYDGIVYLNTERGEIIALDAQSGDELYFKPVHRSNHRATPVAAEGRVYLCAQDGTVNVLQAGREYKLLATNKMGEWLTATPALSAGRIYLRTYDALYAVGSR